MEAKIKLVESAKAKLQQEYKELLNSYNELRKANDEIEEDNKSFIDKISNIGEQFVERSKYQELKKLQMQTEQNMIKFQNQYLMEKAEAEGVRAAMRNAKKEFD